MSWLRSFFSNLGDAVATGGDTEAFNARRGARLQREGRDPEWNQFIASLGRVARQAWEKAEIKEVTRGDREVQYDDGDNRVVVKCGYSRDYKCWTTDVFVFPLSVGGGAHWHVVFDDRGNIINNTWRGTGRNK